MENHEAQMRAIKLTAGDERGESGAQMDMEGRVHKCPSCGHEMPMDEVMGHTGAERLTSGDQRGLGGAHMDKQGSIG